MGRNKLHGDSTLPRCRLGGCYFCGLSLLLIAEIKREISPCRDEIKSLKSKTPESFIRITASRNLPVVGLEIPLDFVFERTIEL